MEAVKSTFATTRVNRLIGRAFSAAALLLTAESTLNFLGQLQYLNDLAAWIVAAGLWSTTLVFTYSYWFGQAKPIYLRIHAIYAFGLVLIWPLLINAELPLEGKFYPWIWWAVDTAWIAAALSFKIRWSLLYLFGMNLIMQIIFSTPFGGSHPTPTLITDYLFTLLTNGTAAVIALLLRAAAERTDAANTEAIESRVLEARAEARAREQQRLDALVHDRVLTALITAANANNPIEVKAASDLASSALEKLAEVEKGEPTGSIYVEDLFDSIISVSRRLDPKIEASITEQSNWSLSQEVGTALTEATLQAIQNSMFHAGGKAKRELFLKSVDDELKIVIRDNGRGFRPNRIPKGRLGIKVSIIARVEAVGGKVHISSQPGQGATVVLEWVRA